MDGREHAIALAKSMCAQENPAALTIDDLMQATGAGHWKVTRKIIPAMEQRGYIKVHIRRNGNCGYGWMLPDKPKK